MSNCKYIIYGTDNRLTYSPHYYYVDEVNLIREWEDGFRAAYFTYFKSGADFIIWVLTKRFPHMTFHIQEIHE